MVRPRPAWLQHLHRTHGVSSPPQLRFRFLQLGLAVLHLHRGACHTHPGEPCHAAPGAAADRHWNPTLRVGLLARVSEPAIIHPSLPSCTRACLK